MHFYWALHELLSRVHKSIKILNNSSNNFVGWKAWGCWAITLLLQRLKQTIREKAMSEYLGARLHILRGMDLWWTGLSPCQSTFVQSGSVQRCELLRWGFSGMDASWQLSAQLKQCNVYTRIIHTPVTKSRHFVYWQGCSFRYKSYLATNVCINLATLGFKLTPSYPQQQGIFHTWH